MGVFVSPRFVPRLQVDATLNQTNPTSGLKYTVLDTTPKVECWGIDVKVTWTGQPDPLEVHLTIDGNADTTSFTNPVSTAVYRMRALADPTTKYDLLATVVVQGLLLKAQSLKVEVETTGGTVSNMTANVWYSIY